MTLRELLVSDTYAGLSDQEAADAINALTEPVTLVPRWQIKSYLYGQGVYGTMTAYLDSTEIPANLRGLIRTALAYLNDPDFENLDLGLADVQTMLGMLVSAGLLTTVQLAEIKAMQSVRAAWPLVDASEIAVVRGTRSLIQRETENA